MTGPTVIALGERAPSIAETAWLAVTATVIGAANLDEGVSVFYGAVVRADAEAVWVGAGTNLQDLVTVHADPGFPARIGRRVSVGHGAILHGCTVEDDCLIGMGAIVMNGARIGAGSLVAAGSVVLEGVEVPPGSLVAGSPATVKRSLRPDEAGRLAQNADGYARLREIHRAAGPAPATDDPTR
jgi:carbonic anhydrase/acetyltransferase-like protein (isoleucine patch superfamily)